jgi:hypothetical protein
MTDIIERSPMHNEDQLLKVADVIMALIEPRLKERIQQMIEENSDDMGTRQEDIDDQISNWMSMNFDLSDYSDFSIHDHEYEIGTMINEHLEEREDDSDFDERVFKALGNIDMKFGNMTITHGSSTIVKE